MTATSARILKAKYSWTIGVVFSEELNIGLEHPSFRASFRISRHMLKNGAMNSVSSSSSLAKTNFLILIGAETRKSTVSSSLSGINDRGIIELIESEIKCVSTDIVNDNIHSVRSDNRQNRTP